MRCVHRDRRNEVRLMRLFVDVPQVFLHRDPIDFRKAINGLVVLVELGMARSPYEEAVFVFTNKQRNKLKILYWDETGFCLWQKRLEVSKFAWPKRHDDAVIAWREEQLHWLLRGFDVSKIVPHQRLIYGANLTV